MNRVKKTSRLFGEWRPEYEQRALIRQVMRKYDLTERQARKLIRKGAGR